MDTRKPRQDEIKQHQDVITMNAANTTLGNKTNKTTEKHIKIHIKNPMKKQQKRGPRRRQKEPKQYRKNNSVQDIENKKAIKQQMHKDHMTAHGIRIHKNKNKMRSNNTRT